MRRVLPAAPLVFWMAISVVAGLLPGLPASAQDAGDKPDLAIMPFDKRGVDDDLAATLLDSFQVQFVKSSGIPVVGPSEIATVIGFERQKELLGCDEGSCFAEIGGALGVRFLVSGRFAKLGKSWLVTVRLVDARRTLSLLQDQETVSGEDEQVLLAAVQTLAKRFGRESAAKIKAAGGVVKQTPAKATSSNPQTSGDARDVQQGSVETPRAKRSAGSPPSWMPWLWGSFGTAAFGFLSVVGFVIGLVVTLIGYGGGAAAVAYLGLACMGLCGLGLCGATVAFGVLAPITLIQYFRASRYTPPSDVDDVADEKPAKKAKKKKDDDEGAEETPKDAEKPASAPPAAVEQKAEENKLEEKKPDEKPAAAPTTEKPASVWDELDPPEKKKKKRHSDDDEDSDEDDSPRRKKKRKNR